MRSLAPLLLLLAGLVPLRAQWQIFAVKLPAPGTCHNTLPSATATAIADPSRLMT